MRFWSTDAECMAMVLFDSPYTIFSFLKTVIFDHKKIATNHVKDSVSWFYKGTKKFLAQSRSLEHSAVYVVDKVVDKSAQGPGKW